MHIDYEACFLLQAYKLGMKYPKYVFITYASYMSKWWVTPEDEECSSDNIAEVLQFSLTALYFYTTSGDKLYYDVCYDAVLALADSLHEVSQKMDLGYADSMSSQWWTMSDNRECEQNFHNICRRGSELHSLLNEHLVMVNFTGQSVSLEVEYVHNEERGRVSYYAIVTCYSYLKTF